MIVSDPLIGETERTLEKLYFADRLTRRQRENNTALLRSEATVTPLTVTVTGVATHPEDDLGLAAAVSVGADYLVTGDRNSKRWTRSKVCAY